MQRVGLRGPEGVQGPVHVLAILSNSKTRRDGEEAVSEERGVSEWIYLLSFQAAVKACPRRIAAVYLQCSSDHLTRDSFQGTPQGALFTSRTRPPGILIKRRAATKIMF